MPVVTDKFIEPVQYSDDAPPFGASTRLHLLSKEKVPVVRLLQFIHRQSQPLVVVDLLPCFVGIVRYARPFGVMPISVFVESCLETLRDTRLETGSLEVCSARELCRLEFGPLPEHDVFETCVMLELNQVAIDIA